MRNLYSFDTIVEDRQGNRRELTFSSIYSNPQQAVEAFEGLNRYQLRVVELRATLSASEASLKLEPAATPSVPLESPAPEPEQGFTTVLDDVVDMVVDGNRECLTTFAEYDKGRCELSLTYSLDSKVSDTVVVVANSLQAAINITLVMVMQGHLTAACRRLKQSSKLADTIERQREWNV